MGWIYHLDFLWFLGPSLGYLWMTLNLILVYYVTCLNVYLLFLFTFHLSAFSPVLSSSVSFLLCSVCLSICVWWRLKLKMYRNKHFSPSCLHCHSHGYIRIISESYSLRSSYRTCNFTQIKTCIIGALKD